MFALMSSVVGFAQLSEVKGVETKLVIYDGSKYEVCVDFYYDRYKSSTKWFGYSFYNMNSIPVSVEAELYKKGRLVTTKTFNLKSNETYIWKHEGYGEFKVNECKECFGEKWTNEKIGPGEGYYSSQGGYYVKYKAYRIL